MAIYVPGKLTLRQQHVEKLLLDTYAGAAAAYSLRQLRTGVSSVVRVRRSSDAAELDFTADEISNGTLTAWVGAGYSGHVITWYDQSGNNNHANGFTTISTSSPPRIVLNGALEVDSNTSKPTLLFTGYQAFTFSRLTGEQLFTVVRNNSSTSRIVSRDSGNLRNVTDVRGLFLQLGPSTWNMQQIGPSPVPGQTLLQQNSTYSLGILANGTNAVYYTNGAASSTFAESDRIQANELGRYHVSSFNLAGYLSEYILYTNDQSANRAAIEANINAHYAIY